MRLPVLGVPGFLLAGGAQSQVSLLSLHHRGLPLVTWMGQGNRGGFKQLDKPLIPGTGIKEVGSDLETHRRSGGQTAGLMS